MKRLVSCILILALALLNVCMGEESEYEGVAPLFEMIMSAPAFQSFKEAPEYDLAAQTVSLFRRVFATPSEALSDEEIYALVFACGVMPDAAKADEDLTEPPEFLPVRVSIENAVDSGIGTVIISVKSEKDYGYGFEFDMYADFHILSDENAPFGARIARVFIPE